MYCCASRVLAFEPSPAGVAQRTRAVFIVAHPMVPCNISCSRDGRRMSDCPTDYRPTDRSDSSDGFGKNGQKVGKVVPRHPNKKIKINI